jgi:hypothetical protein
MNFTLEISDIVGNQRKRARLENKGLIIWEAVTIALALREREHGGGQFLPESPRPQRPRTDSDGPSGIATGPS